MRRIFSSRSLTALLKIIPPRTADDGTRRQGPGQEASRGPEHDAESCRGTTTSPDGTVRYSECRLDGKHVLIRLPDVNSISPQMKSFPLKPFKIPRKSQEAFYFKVNLITESGCVFSTPPPMLNYLSFSPTSSVASTVEGGWPMGTARAHSKSAIQKDPGRHLSG